MNDELFPVESVQMDSPRLAWIKKYGVVTYHSLPNGDDHCWFAGFQEWWPTLTNPVDFFCKETGCNGDQNLTEGETEDEAIIKLALYNEIPLWNEAEFVKNLPYCR
jgi:hypothetical protein